MPSTPSARFADPRSRRGWTVAAFALAALVTSSARAQEPFPASPADGAVEIDPAARRLAERGLAHYEAGRYAEAIQDFQASYRITPAPGLLYNLAQAQRRNGDCAAALESYRRFLAEDPAGNIRQLTEARIAEAERCVAEKDAPPVPASLPPAEAKPAAATSIVAVPSPAPEAEREGARIGWRRIAGYGLGATALVAGVASARYGWQANQASDDVTAIYDRDGTWGPWGMAREASGRADERTALWLGAAALVSAGVSMWLILRR